MIKKLTVPIVFALVLALLVSTAAFAADDPPPLKHLHVYGQITALGENSFTVQPVKEGSEEITFMVDPDTHYRDLKTGPADFDQLDVGGKAAVRGQVGGDQQIRAQFVLLLPDDFSPGDRFDRRARGQVSEINLNANTFSLLTMNGRTFPFTVGAETRFIGRADGLTDLRISQPVIAAGRPDGDGPALATAVITRPGPRPKPFAGTVTDVDPSAGTFLLNTRRGDQLTFAVDENTQFISPEDEIQSLADMQVDMVAVLGALPPEDGVHLVTRIAIGEKGDLPKFELKVRGRITALGDHSLTVQTVAGRTILFQTSDETRLRGRAGIQSLDDLEIGMGVFIGGRELDTGALFAQWVV
ncbi:MAG: DUF5666 domain-containing protein, partial [Chloroflexota bacterium]